MKYSLLLFPVLGFLVYLPGLPGAFLFDDYPNILDNGALTTSTFGWKSLVSASLSGDAGPLKRPLSMFTFALNYALGGASPVYFKLTNIAIHVANALLVFSISRLIVIRLQYDSNETAIDLSRLVPFSVALIWMVHPINLTSVLYIVQRMTSLAALFVLLGIQIFLVARMQMLSGDKGFTRMLFGTLGAGLLAVFSKENGILLFAYLFVIEITFFRFKTHNRQSNFWLKIYFSALVIIPAVCIVGFLALNYSWLVQHYEFRSFTLLERLLTEARALCFYIKMLFLPNSVSLGLFHDDIRVSTGLFSPFSTFLSVAAIGLALTSSILFLRTYKVLAFAVLWFLVGHILESTIWPLELVHEHRNYTPSIGPLFCVVYTMIRLVHVKKLYPILRFSPLGMAILLTPVTALRAADWGDFTSLAKIEAIHHPKSPRSQYELGRAYLTLYVNTKRQQYLARAEQHLQIASKLNESDPLPLFGLIHLAFMDHKQPSQKTLEILNETLRKERVRPTTITALQKLVECTVKDACHLPPNNVLQLFGNLLNNPTLNRDYKAKTLTQLSSYYTNILGDQQTAITILNEIVGMFPADCAYRINLVKILLVNGETERALRELNAGRKHLTKLSWKQNRIYWEEQFLELENSILKAGNQKDPYVRVF